MSDNAVNAGRRMAIRPTVDVTAGDLIYYNGFFGVSDDDIATGQLGTLILDVGVRDFTNVYGSTIAMGTIIYAAPSVIATSALLYPAASVPAGGRAIGRAAATGVASSATATLRVRIDAYN